MMDLSSDVCSADLRADSIMQSRDRTTWDDPSKRSVTEAAAKYTESQLDGMVSGDVSDNWSNLLIQRAEAFKQEAFFRSVNADAITSEQAARKALADYNEIGRASCRERVCQYV